MGLIGLISLISPIHDLPGIFIMICMAIERRVSRKARKIKNPAPEECAGFVEALWNPSGSLAVFLRGASCLKSPRSFLKFAGFITEPSNRCQASGLMRPQNLSHFIYIGFAPLCNRGACFLRPLQANDDGMSLSHSESILHINFLHRRRILSHHYHQHP